MTMTESELRDKCGLKPGQLIPTNKGLMDILSVNNEMATLGVLATGQVIQESCESIIHKLNNPKSITK